MLKINKKAVELTKTRSAWSKGVKIYALELIEYLEEEEETLFEDYAELEKALLNGAENWSQYSYGGCSLIYDFKIAKRLCTPSELKKCKGGELPPNKKEMWLDVQARALFQAYILIVDCCEYIQK